MQYMLPFEGNLKAISPLFFLVFFGILHHINHKCTT